MREARELQTHIDELVKHIAHLDKQLQDVVLAKPEMPTKIIGPNLEEILNAAGFYRGDAVCCNDYEKCIKPCTPKGRWLAEKELAKPEQEPFKPDWANYWQGLIDGAAQAKLAKPEQEQEPESHIVKWSIPVDPNNFGEPLAQFEQEPVAWMVRDQVDGCRYPSALKNPAGSINGESQPLYITPPPKREWVGLTDDEIHKIVDACTPDEAEQEELNDFARAVRFAEAKLKEKNT
jgi:hypothetical protein